jgi:hypothetical protein
MLKQKLCNSSVNGFALPLVLIMGALLLGSGVSLQSMAMQSRARGAMLWQEGLLNDGFHNAAMVFVAAARRGESSPDQDLGAGSFRLIQWQGSPTGPAQFSVQRLADPGRLLRSRSFQLSSDGRLQRVSP